MIRPPISEIMTMITPDPGAEARLGLGDQTSGAQIVDRAGNTEEHDQDDHGQVSVLGCQNLPAGHEGEDKVEPNVDHGGPRQADFRRPQQRETSKKPEEASLPCGPSPSSSPFMLRPVV